MTDGAGSEMHERMGSIMVNPLGTVNNQGCRPGVTTRDGAEGLCAPALARVGPVVASDDMGADPDAPFAARFGERPRIMRVEVGDPDAGDAIFGEGDVVRLNGVFEARGRSWEARGGRQGRGSVGVPEQLVGDAP